MARRLVSKFVDEDQDGIKLICRASNIAHWFTQNFSDYSGTLVSMKNLREEIVSETGETPGTGDFRVHGRAVGLLNLNLDTVSGENYVEFSLINLKRCASFLLGRGRISHGITLIKDPSVSADAVESDDDLIDQGLALSESSLTSFERIFTRNLNKKVRGRDLSSSQRAKLLQIINERS